VTLMEGVLAGSSELDRQYVIRAIHDQLFNGPTTIGSADVILLAFLILQVDPLFISSCPPLCPVLSVLLTLA
jgi:hypothetical protein